MRVIGWTPATLLSPHFLPGYIRAEPGRTGRDLECSTFYPGSKKTGFKLPGHDRLRPGMKKNEQEPQEEKISDLEPPVCTNATYCQITFALVITFAASW